MNSVVILVFSVTWLFSQFLYGAIDPSKISSGLSKTIQTAPPEIKVKIRPIVVCKNSDLQKNPAALNKW